jgi:flagellar assembly protein FliH
MALSTLVAFDRTLASATLEGGAGRVCTEKEAAAKAQEAYNAGVDAARRAGDQQMIELRAEMAQLSDGVLKQLASIEPQLVAQLREALPGLALEIARRLLAGYEPPPDVIERLWRESLDQLYPEREGLELTLCPRDAELLERLNPEWRHHYPGLRVRTDAALKPGDSLVRSRFGLTDARQQTKVETFAQGLNGD